MEPLVKPRNIFAAPKLSEPVQVFDPTKTVEQNMAGMGTPSANDIASAYTTPTAKVQINQPAVQKTQVKQTPQFNGDPTDPNAGMAYLNSLYTSPQEEERLRKANVMNQRILAIGDAVRHIGNIANTVNWAPAQQFNSPVQEEQARYEKGKAFRDRANQQYYTYQQQKAQQDAQMRKLDADTKYQNASLAIRQKEHKRLLGAQKLAERKQEAYERIKDEELALKKLLAENKISVDEYNARSRRLSAEAAWLRADKYQPGGSGGVGGYETTTETTHEPEYTNPITGEVTKWKSKTTRTRTSTKKQLPGQSNTNKKKLPNQ